jgi:hypothetical protein
VGSPQLKDRARRQRLIALWQHLPEERTEDKILVFCGWLEENHPQLLKCGRGDPSLQPLPDHLRGLQPAPAYPVSFSEQLQVDLDRIRRKLGSNSQDA